MTRPEDVQEYKKRIETLETQVKHLTNDLRLTKEEYRIATADYFEIYSDLERNATQLEERTDELADVNQKLRAEIIERKQTEEENKRLQAHFAHAQKMEAIGTLAGGIAHDFNNLLSVIQGNVSLMLADIASTHPHYEHLSSIEKQIQSASRLTIQLLGFARKGKYEVKPVDLNQLIQETSEAFGRSRKEITVHRDLEENLFAIEADKGQIEQVLLNLFVNAAYAMTEGGDLFLSTMNLNHKDMNNKLYNPKPGEYVLLAITDTGAGMDSETVGRIFEPFFTTKEMGRGTGLGLASVYGIVKGHGGYIEVESEKGHGTTFSIYLPATGGKAERTVDTRDQILENSGTVLLVDDEEMVLNVGRKVLERLGYSVLVAECGKEALEVYQTNKDRIDLIILDMIMPDIGGGEVYDRIKEVDPNVKVLLSSGYSVEGQANEILKRGCNAFIQKPYTMQQLSQSIGGIIGTE
jgi:signal transduction histidine kinase/CheY-like chemotaxis protein